MDLEAGICSEGNVSNGNSQNWIREDGGFNFPFSTEGGDPETLSVCNNQDSNETNTLRQVISRNQVSLLREILDAETKLDRPRFIEMLSRYREVLLSARECIAARVESKVQSHPSIRKKISKKAKHLRKRTTFGGPLGPVTDFGVQGFLPHPLVIDPTTEMYYTEDSLSDASEDNFTAQVKDYGSTGDFGETSNDELYGLARLEYDAYDRNPYFNMALGDSMNDLAEFE